MNIPGVTQDAKNIEITWSTDSTNGDDITSYEMQFWTGSAFEAKTSVCNPLISTNPAECVVTFQDYMTNVGVGAGVEILVRIRAQNGRGMGPYSDT